MKAEKFYKDMHEWRVRLLCAGMLNDKENENIKKKIESWGRKNKVPTVSESMATLRQANKILAEHRK